MLDALTGQLEGGLPLLSETIGCWVAESEVADLLRRCQDAHEGCQIGSYPFFREGKVGANFVIRSTNAEALKACCNSLIEGLTALGYTPVPGGI
jgi:molybdopterin-biosynthesis enzyme MoeA-like protein